MQLRKLSAADADQVRSVWKECFHDTDEFLDVYFESAARISDGTGIFDDTGKLISDLFVLNVEAQIDGMVYPSRFIAGCATLPEARNQHQMRNLFTNVLSAMGDNGICAVYLYPFLHSFYRKFGFETVSYVQRSEEDAASAPDSSVQIATSLDQVPVSAFHASYMDFVSSYSNYFMRTLKRTNAWLSLLFSDGGKAAFINGKDNTPYCLYYETKDSDGSLFADVFELVCFNEEQKGKLLSGLGMNAHYFVPTKAVDRGASEYTMMRVLRPDLMLQSYEYPADTAPFVINIHDSFMEKDYNYLVTPGKQGATTKEVGSESDIVVDIQALAQLLTGIYSPADFPAASGIFSTASSCYFENY